MILNGNEDLNKIIESVGFSSDLKSKALLNKLAEKEYNGYTSCPLVTGYGKMVLAEFDYSQKFSPDPKLKQFPLLIRDSSKEHWRLWILKKYNIKYNSLYLNVLHIYLYNLNQMKIVKIKKKNYDLYCFFMLYK